MATIKKDNTITAVSITKIRKKLTSFGYDPNPNGSVIYITYDQIALDTNGNEVYVMTSGSVDQIPQSRFAEPLIAAWIAASQNMILNEF